MSEFKDYEGLNRAITNDSGLPIVTKWLVLGEGVDDDGDRRAFFFSSEDCAHWDELGLMEWRSAWRKSQSD